MSALTVRDLDLSVKARLRERAARHGRSMEAEVRQILADAVADGDGHRNLVESLMHHFAGNDTAIELPDRSTQLQRPIDL